MTRSAFARLEDVILDSGFPDLDVALRKGRHVGRDDGMAYQLLVDGQEHLEAFYLRYGCDLVLASEGYFYLRPTGDRFGRRQLTRAEMLVGQVLALLLLDPISLQSGGLVPRVEVLGRLEMLVGRDALVRLLNPQVKKVNERVAEESIRSKIQEALRGLESLGFVGLVDGDQVRLRPALFRFAEPVRGHSNLGEALERLVREGEVAVEPAADCPDGEP